MNHHDNVKKALDNNSITIATRGSDLATCQAKQVSCQLNKLGFKTRIMLVDSYADKHPNTNLSVMANSNKSTNAAGSKSAFCAEISKKLQDNQADIAVHSLKDLPLQISYLANLTQDKKHKEHNYLSTSNSSAIVAVLKRVHAEDVLLVKKSVISANNKKLNLTTHQNTGFYLKKDHDIFQLNLNIATSSIRRQCLLKLASKSINTFEIRGNIDTRLKKVLSTSDLDGLVLSKAAIYKLLNHPDYSNSNFNDKVKVNIKNLVLDYDQFILDPRWFIPAPGQGVVAIEAKTCHKNLSDFKMINNNMSYIQTLIERHMIKVLGGDCMLPFGCYSYLTSDYNHQKNRIDYNINVYTTIVDNKRNCKRSFIKYSIPKNILTFVSSNNKKKNNKDQGNDYLDDSVNLFVGNIINCSINILKSDLTKKIYKNLKIELPNSLK